MKSLRFLPLFLLLFSACNNSNDIQPNTGQSRNFTVRVENVSTQNLIPTVRAMGAVPLSPGNWALFTGANPIFTLAQLADSGLELVAEDGIVSVKDSVLATIPTVKEHGIFQTSMGQLMPGEFAEFSFKASPGDMLQFATMFAQSNDWFYGFVGGTGLALFNGDIPISGNQTSKLALYDAGTEMDTPPGTGPDQKPVQTMDNQGPSESVVVSLAALRHPTYTIPSKDSVIRITITHD